MKPFHNWRKYTVFVEGHNEFLIKLEIVIFKVEVNFDDLKNSIIDLSVLKFLDKIKLYDVFSAVARP